MPQLAPRHEGVERSSSHHRCIDRDAPRVAADTGRIVETRQSGRLDQRQCRETMRITRSQYNRVGRR